MPLGLEPHAMSLPWILSRGCPTLILTLYSGHPSDSNLVPVLIFSLHLSGTDMSRTGAKLVTGTHLSLVHEGVTLWKPWCAIQQLK